MRLGVLGVISALAACADDPFLQVTVDHPIDVARTTVTVYESSTLSCDDIAFGRIAATELSALVVAEETIDKMGKITGGLTGLSRTDGKIVVARGFDGTGTFITAGCGSKGTVDDRTTLAITTMTTVDVSILPPDPNGADPLGAAVAATDTSGKAVAARRVAWTVYAPAGAEPVSTTTNTVSDGVWEPGTATCTASNGLVRIHPVPPGVVGGYAVQARVEWAVDLPPRYTSLTSADFTLTPLVPPTGATKFCAVRVAGATRRLVCLVSNAAQVFAHDYSVAVANGHATLMDRGNVQVLDNTIGLVTVPNGTDRDVYGITIRGVLIPLFGAPTPDNSQLPCTLCTVDDVILVPPCGAAPAKLIVHTDAIGAGELKQLNAHGGGVSDFPTTTTADAADIQLDNAGCVQRLDPNGSATLRQVVTYHVGTQVLNEFVAAATRVAYNCSGATCSTSDLLVGGAGVGFTPGSEPRMIATSVDATGVVLVELVMTPDTMNRDRFIERARFPAASAPEHVVVGEYDTDSTTDIVWNISTRRGSSFELAYAREISGDRLEALSPVKKVTVNALYSTDLTGDGLDDVIVVGADAVVGTGVAVIPMHAPIAAQAVTDTTCAP